MTCQYWPMRWFLLTAEKTLLCYTDRFNVQVSTMYVLELLKEIIYFSIIKLVFFCSASAVFTDAFLLNYMIFYKEISHMNSLVIFGFNKFFWRACLRWCDFPGLNLQGITFFRNDFPREGWWGRGEREPVPVSVISRKPCISKELSSCAS